MFVTRFLSLYASTMRVELSFSVFTSHERQHFFQFCFFFQQNEISFQFSFEWYRLRECPTSSVGSMRWMSFFVLSICYPLIPTSNDTIMGKNQLKYAWKLSVNLTESTIASWCNMEAGWVYQICTNEERETGWSIKSTEVWSNHAMDAQKGLSKFSNSIENAK